MSFKIIMTTSVIRPRISTKHQTCKTKTTVCKTKTDFLVSDRSCPKTDGLRPHYWIAADVLATVRVADCCIQTAGKLRKCGSIT